ncbi:MAG: hypothetical protein LKJ01_08670 [Lactobacillus sp.]|jgi:preprotein translocase subunit SecB|nr:hypothetical protein [Lactobacillus sp.]MCI2017306.1 hypothetical protein [Lactobacillus sp.]MCI2037218.1 hypothetical protein [Lactobacillus sp.]
MTNKDNNVTGPVVKLDTFRVTQVHYNRLLSKGEWDKLDEADLKPTIEMSYSIAEDLRHGKCNMTAHIVREEQRQYGDITVVGFFTFRDDITKLEDQKKYLAVNGGAMLYPYLRATASMVTTLDNSDTTILPTLNFAEQFRELHAN